MSSEVAVPSMIAIVVSHAGSSVRSCSACFAAFLEVRRAAKTACVIVARQRAGGLSLTQLSTDKLIPSGNSPLSIRKSDHYQAEYIQAFVQKWDELIDWKARARGEGSFFIDLLRRLGVQKVLDVATGTGFHSVQLLKAGFQVTSADGNATMLTKAFENARREDFVLRTIQADWRWLSRDVHDKYDAIICLGNSFTHLFSEQDRRRALAEFYSALRHDGVLILDQRNYDALIDCGTKPKHAFYYCGKLVKAEPEHLDEGLARFRYQFPDGSVFHLNMFPLRREYTRRLLREVGFQDVQTYGDFQATFHEPEPDFLVHVASKAYLA